MIKFFVQNKLPVRTYETRIVRIKIDVLERNGFGFEIISNRLRVH